MHDRFGLKEVAAFVRIVDLGGFKAAAQELHVTPSALTQRLQKLEEAVGARLVDRTTRTVAATAVGRAFLPEARRMIGQFDRAVADLEDMIQARGGRVTIASLISVATHVLPRVLGRFSAAHPDVSVRVLDDAEREIAEYVRQGDAEFAVDMLTAETEADPDLAASVLMEDPFVLACPAGHPLAAGGPLRLEALFGQPIVTLGARTGTSRLLLDRLEATGRPLPWRYEVQHLSTLIGFVEAGVAVGLAPRLAMRPLAGRRLAHRPLDEPGLNRTVALIERRGATLSPSAARLKDMILAEARDWPPAG